MDTVLYTLAGLAGDERGWGIDGDTWTALEMLKRYRLPTWFRLGDRDLATHLARTQWLREGRRPTEVTAALASALGVVPRVLPMTDARVATFVSTPAGRLPFQEYFVRRGARDPVTGVEFEGIEHARPSPEVLDAIRSSAVIIIAPSNPVVSIGPILALQGMRDALSGGTAVKGPTVEMLRGLGMRADSAAVAARYGRFIDVFVLDIRDRALRDTVAAAGPPAQPPAVECADTLMTDPAGRRRLARALIDIAARHGIEVAATTA